jgi:hypothetical protein
MEFSEWKTEDKKSYISIRLVLNAAVKKSSSSGMMFDPASQGLQQEQVSPPCMSCKQPK